MGISLFAKENTDPDKREPENLREKTYKLVYQRTYTSGFVIVMTLLGFVFGFIPLGIFGVLPNALAEVILVIIVANAFAFLPARHYHIKYNDIPRDYIFEVDADNEEKIIRYEFYRGHFADKFDFDGKPLTWNTKYGRKAFLVRNIDHKEQRAQCPELGEYSDLEKMEQIERIKESRLENRKDAKFGKLARIKFGTIVEKIESIFVTRLSRKANENTLLDPEVIEETIKDEFEGLDIDKPGEEDGNLAQRLIEDVNADITIESEDLRDD